MAKGRVTGFTRFIMAMLIIIPLAIVGSLFISGEEITVDNIIDTDKWTQTKKKDVEVKDDTKIIRTDKDVTDEPRRVKVKDKDIAPPPREETTTENKGLKDLLNDKLKNPKKDKDPEPEVADNTENEILPASADVKALQARISRLEDDIKEKDSRIERLYEENGTLKKKLDDLKRALN